MNKAQITKAVNVLTFKTFVTKTLKESQGKKVDAFNLMVTASRSMAEVNHYFKGNSDKALLDYVKEMHEGISLADAKAVRDSLKEVAYSKTPKGKLKLTLHDVYDISYTNYQRYLKVARYSDEELKEYLSDSSRSLSKEALNRYMSETYPDKYPLVKQSGKTPTESANKKKKSSSSSSPSSKEGHKVEYDLMIKCQKLEAFLKFGKDGGAVENHFPQGKLDIDLLTKVKREVNRLIKKAQDGLLEEEAKKSA
jgi:hypothetical protein